MDLIAGETKEEPHTATVLCKGQHGAGCSEWLLLLIDW